MAGHVKCKCHAAIMRKMSGRESKKSTSHIGAWVRSSRRQPRKQKENQHYQSSLSLTLAITLRLSLSWKGIAKLISFLYWCVGSCTKGSAP